MCVTYPDKGTFRCQVYHWGSRNASNTSQTSTVTNTDYFKALDGQTQHRGIVQRMTRNHKAVPDGLHLVRVELLDVPADDGVVDLDSLSHIVPAHLPQHRAVFDIGKYHREGSFAGAFCSSIRRLHTL